jgi:hypothetical protein
VTLQEERDQWEQACVDARMAAAGGLYEHFRDRITDELDKKLGAASALSVATVLATCAEQRARTVEAERDEAEKRIGQLELQLERVDAERAELRHRLEATK